MSDSERSTRDARVGLADGVGLLGLALAMIATVAGLSPAIGRRPPAVDLLALAGLGLAALGAVARLRLASPAAPAKGRFRPDDPEFRLLFDSALVGITVVRPDGAVEEANDAFLGLVGLTRDEFRADGLKWTDITPPEHAARDRQAVRDILLDGRSAPYEKEYLARDGRRVPVMVGTTRIDPDTGLSLCFVHDLSPRKAVEDELRSKEEQYRQLFDLNPDASWVLDEETLGFLAVNEAATVRYGYSREEFARMTILDIRINVDPDAFREYLRTHQGGVQGMQSSHRTRTGEILDVEVTTLHLIFAGRPARLVIVRDLTEANRMVRTLRENEAHYRTLAEALPHVIWTAGPGGEVEEPRPGGTLVWSPGSTRPSAEWLRLIHPDDRENSRRAWAEAVENGSAYEVEHRVRRGDAGWVWGLSRAVPLRDPDGKVLRWVGTTTDIHRVKHAEEALVVAVLAAETASRSKDRFLAVLSHELRTPLTPVLAAHTALLGRTDIPLAMRQVVEMTCRNIEREACLIDDLLDVSQITQGAIAFKAGRHDLHDLLGRALDDARAELEAAEIQVIRLIDAEETYIEGDADRLRQVLGNVVQNLLKFSPRGSRAWVRTRNIERGSEHQDLVADEATAAATGDQRPRIRVDITDEGVGLAQEDLGRIFNAFEQGEVTLRRRYGGLGLGLTISRYIAERHGGLLWASSPGKGKGSTFSLLLPTAPPPAMCHIPLPANEPEVPPLPPPANANRNADADDDRPAMTATGAASDARVGVPVARKGLRILVVEDNKDTLRILSMLLEQAGHQVAAQPSFARAMDYVDSGASFDIVLSDIELSDGTGLELMRHIRATRSSPDPVPGIAMSGFGSDEDIELSMDAGFAEHMTKPLDYRRLESTLWRVSGKTP